MQKSYDTSVSAEIAGAKVAILQAAWHSEHTDRMVAACKDLLIHAKCGEVDCHRVPGSYELPLAAKLLAKEARYDAIVIFGAIVKGQTDHYHVILETCIRELGKVMYDFEVPIIMELMPVLDITDLIERSSGENNKGIEAAQATIEMLAWVRSLKLAV